MYVYLGKAVGCDIPRRMFFAPYNTLQDGVLLIMWRSLPRLVLIPGFNIPGVQPILGAGRVSWGDLRTCKPVPDPKRPCHTLLEHGTVRCHPTYVS